MRCLYCGREMSGKISEMERESGWHKRCVKAFFGTNTMPVLDLTEEGLLQLAVRMTGKGLTVPGVQKKLSLHLSRLSDRLYFETADVRVSVSAGIRGSGHETGEDRRDTNCTSCADQDGK